MKKNIMILGENQYFSMDTHETQLNNNVLVVGASGAGKTRGIVIPNLIEATGSYVVVDPKGNLHGKYGKYLEDRGYKVKKLDFTDPIHSEHYNFFNYIENTMDIVKISRIFVEHEDGRKSIEPFWEESSELLFQAVIAYLWEACKVKDRTLQNVLKLIEAANVNDDVPVAGSPLACMMDKYAERKPESFAVKTYRKVACGANRTYKSILISAMSEMGFADTKEMGYMTQDDTVDIKSIGKEKTALFVVVSDTDRSLDKLVNIFFSQAMNELCRYADRECDDNRLPVPVRFILDDFATNCRIAEFPRMISSIRSRGISTMLMVQAESQLKAGYGDDGSTIIGNCDTYVYLGSNDLETAKSIAFRCDTPLKKIMYMPVGNIWIFRRGQEPVNGKRLDLDRYILEKEKREKDMYMEK